MDTASAFEWELSKENVARLHGGRSADLLNKVLSSLNTDEFQDIQTHLKQHFELKLASLPNSFVKLRLYLRYIYWIEQTHPSLHRSTAFETLLFRCVRDCGQLPNVKNDEDFVGVWIRLTEYCDQPGELFELLFRQGVGTMCAKFYEAWANWLGSNSQPAHAAAVYAHGLRAGAQPLFHLEDHAELFVARLHAHPVTTTATGSDLGTDFTASSSVTNRPSCRQTLAALSLVQKEPDPGSDVLKVPVVRTSSAWHVDQSGLCNSKHVSTSAGNCHRIPRVNSKPVCNASDLENPSVAPLYTLPAVPQRKNEALSVGSDLPIRPFRQPSEWQKENIPKATTWNNQKLSSTKEPALHRSQPEWHVYSDEVTDGTPHDRDRCSSSQTNSTLKKRKGLVVLRGAPLASSLVRPAPSLLNLTAFMRFLDTSNPVSTAEVDSSGCVNVLQRVDLPCLPVDHLPSDSSFGFPLTLIYGSTEELCWEMHRGTRWLSTSNDSSCLNTPACRDLWDAESEAILDDISAILRGPDVPKLSRPGEALNTGVGSGRSTLIKSLEQIASGKRPTQTS